MKGKILLIHINQRDQRNLYRILRSTRSHIDFSTDLQESRTRLDDGGYDMLLVDYDNLNAQGVEFLKDIAARRPEVRILVLSQEQDKNRLVELFNAGFLTNLIAKNTTIECEEIVVTVEKILRGDILQDRCPETPAPPLKCPICHEGVVLEKGHW